MHSGSVVGEYRAVVAVRAAASLFYGVRTVEARRACEAAVVAAVPLVEPDTAVARSLSGVAHVIADPDAVMRPVDAYRLRATIEKAGYSV